MVLALASDQRSSESARYLLLCLKAHSAFPAKLQHKVKPLVQVCQFLEFLPGVLRVLHHGEVFSQTDMVLTAAAYPYPCSDVLTFGIIIDGNIHCYECSVCSCDDLAILADASDSVSVNHNLEIVRW